MSLSPSMDSLLGKSVGRNLVECTWFTVEDGVTTEIKTVEQNGELLDMSIEVSSIEKEKVNEQL